MSDEEQQSNRPDRDSFEAQERAQGGFYRRYGFDASANNISYLITDEASDPDLGTDLVTFYYLCQISPHGGTDISGWELGNVLQSLSTRTLKNDWLRMSTSKIQKTTDGEFGKLPNDQVLESALIKQGVYNYAENKSGISSELSDGERIAYGRLKRNLAAVSSRCRTCGDVGKTLEAWVELREQQIMISSAIRDKELGENTLEELSQKLAVVAEKIDQVAGNIKTADLMMNDGSEKEESGKWLNLLKGAVGVNEVFSVCKQWLTNQSDLDPISKLWVYMGRMAEMHPSALEAMAKEWPSFNEAFVGVAALGSGKYALGDNGEKYISGRYGMGFVEEKTGKLVDIDKAVIRDQGGKKVGLKEGIVELGLKQIWVPGKGVVDVVGDGITTGEGKEMRKVAIFSRNLLFLEKNDANGVRIDDIRKKGGEVKLKDGDVSEFLKNIMAFVKGKGKGSSEQEIELAVEMAREVYEFSMLSNWNGVPRDSENRPYYTINNDPLTMSSDPDSLAVRAGDLAMGTDESSLFPYWNGGDWGKLTLTKAKQMAELGKGRKHGLYPLISHLPENLVKPLISQKTIDQVMGGEIQMADVFGGMNANEQFKTYWVDIYKACSVYEFISSQIIGDKDISKAGSELLTLLSQTRVWEGLTKDIDLSLTFVDEMEASRLKVNIVIAAIAAAAKEYRVDNFMTLTEDITSLNQIDILPKGAITADQLNDGGNKMILPLRQLVHSGFVGGSDEVIKILERLNDYSNGKVSDPTLRMSEFKSLFGSDYPDRVKQFRKARRDAVGNRKKRGSK